MFLTVRVRTGIEQLRQLRQCPRREHLSIRVRVTERGHISKPTVRVRVTLILRTESCGGIRTAMVGGFGLY